MSIRIRIPRPLAPIGLAAALAAGANSQTLSTPMAVFKDGHATAVDNNGTAATLSVAGGASAAVAWLNFQSAGIDRATLTKAVLVLNVRGVTTAGTVRAHALSAAITPAEAAVPLASVTFNSAAVLASAPLAAADVGKVIQLDITTAVKAATFHGIALDAGDALVATFGAKESANAAYVLLSYADLGDIAAVSAGPGLTGNAAAGSATLAIGNGAVTAAHLAAGSVGAAALAANAAGSAQLQDRAVTQSKLGAGAVGNSHLAGSAFGTAQLANAAVGSAQLAAGAVTAASLPANSLDDTKIKDFYRTISIPAVGLNRQWNTQAKTLDDGGLLWQPMMQGSLIKFSVAKPTDFNPQGNLITATVWCQVPETSPPAGGFLAFGWNYRSIVVGESDALSPHTPGNSFRSPTQITPGSQSKFFKVYGYLGAQQFTEEVWSFQLTRDAGSGGRDTYPLPIRVVGVSLTYPSTR